MTGFDRKIKKLSKEFKAPESYHKRVDEVLETIQQESVPAPRSRAFVKVAGVVFLLCLLMAGYLCFSSAEVAEASFLGSFKQTILDFFGLGEDESREIGVESGKERALSKPDLMIELKEEVMDSHNIYLVIKITAPSNVEFNENINFDYFGFCRGSNYNVSDVLPGTLNCKMLEVLEAKKNVATYVVDIATDEELTEGEEITAFFKNLKSDPNGDNPQMLAEGMWRVTFTTSYTVSEDITVDGTDFETEDTEYSFLDTTAVISKIKLTPLGMTLVSDVSEVPYEELNTSDTGVTIRLKMLDGSEEIVSSPDPDENIMADGSDLCFQKDERTYIKKTLQFDKAVDTRQVIGVIVEDCYVPLKEFE